MNLICRIEEYLHVKEGDIMEMESIYRKAYELLKTDDIIGIYKAKDIGDSVVFYGGNPDEAYYGIRTVLANKKTGDVDWFDINTNRDMLKNSKEIDIPSEYMYKAS